MAERRAAYELIKALPRLPELDYAPTRKYVEASEAEAGLRIGNISITMC